MPRLLRNQPQNDVAQIAGSKHHPSAAPPARTPAAVLSMPKPAESCKAAAAFVFPLSFLTASFSSAARSSELFKLISHGEKLTRYILMCQVVIRLALYLWVCASISAAKHDPASSRA